MSLFQELKRRNVFRVGIAYVMLGWVVLQGADFMLDLTGAPEWVIRVFAVAGVVGFPFALFFAWAFEMTPEGIKRESEVDRSASIAPQTGRKLNTFIIGALVAVIVLMGVERMYFAGDGARLGQNSTGAVAETPVDVPKSIAVLPFADLSQAQDQEWFADGLAEEILNALVKVPDLQVAARTSSFQFKGSSQSIAEIAAELGVAHVLEGSVRSGNDRIRVTAQLIRASDGFHIWSENYDRDVVDMISIQEDLARNIALALETSMDPEALAEMAKAGTDSVEAYQEYLRGTQLQLNAEAAADAEGWQSFQQAYTHFERAREIDPEFAEAHVQAANYWKVELSPTRTYTGTSGLQPAVALREYNDRIALAIGSAKSEGDRVRILADRAMVDLRLREARLLFEQYLEIRPNDEQARGELATVLLMLSARKPLLELLAYMKLKGETDIFSALNFMYTAYKVIDPSEAANFGLAALQRWPTSSSLIYQTHRTLMWAGRYQEASELAARHAAVSSEVNTLVSAREACAAGDRATAEEFLAGLDRNLSNNLSAEWLLNNLLGNTREEVELLRPLEQSGVPFQLASFLIYHKFDARPYPSLMAVLEREGVQRPLPVTPPFRCPPPEQPSVAVLPFVNMSADAEQEYFSDGITEEIINALVRVPGVKVTARTSVFALKGRDQDIRQTGRELGVTHVLEGSVRSDGQQLRITAQLIQVEDGFHLWSETFDRQRVNVFAIQEEIADAIAMELTQQLAGQDAVEQDGQVGSSSMSPPVSVAAYDNYLRGRAHLRARKDDDLAQARTLFQDVVDAHPGYAPAWAALAITSDVQDDDLEVTERFALKALALDPENVDALNALGAVYRDSWRWADSEAMFDRAMAIDPDSAELLEDLAEFMAGTGRVAEQLQVAGRGYAIDPYLDPLVGVYSEALITAGRYDQAIEVLQKALARGGAQWMKGTMAMAYLAKGDPGALAALINGLEVPDENKTVLLAALDQPDAPEVLASLQALWKQQDGSLLRGTLADMAEILLLHSGHSDIVLQWYTEQFGRRQWGSAEYWFMPLYAGFRAQPEFAGLLAMTHLPEYWDQVGWPEFCQRSENDVIQCH